MVCYMYFLMRLIQDDITVDLPEPNPHICGPDLPPLSVGTPVHYVEMNCLIVKSSGEVGAGHRGESFGDPTSGVSTPSVWKTSHVTHRWADWPAAPPPLS